MFAENALEVMCLVSIHIRMYNSYILFKTAHALENTFIKFNTHIRIIFVLQNINPLKITTQICLVLCYVNTMPQVIIATKANMLTGS